MKIAVTGKGGVGKTLIAAGLAYAFVRRGITTMAIDADPAPNLGLTLGLTEEEVRTITPIAENQDLIQRKTSSGFEGVFRLSFTVEDVIDTYAVDTPVGVPLLVMGTVKGVGTGCTCPANALVRALLLSLLIREREAVVLDMEAGLEHLGRGTAQHVDLMLAVSDMNRKSLEIARSIAHMAQEAGIRDVVLVGNKITNRDQRRKMEEYARAHNLHLRSIIPFDPKVTEAEQEGASPLLLRHSPAMEAIEALSSACLEGQV